MARKSQDLKRIETAEAELAAEIAATDRAQAERRAKLEKLATARHVLEELSGIPPAETATERDVIQELADAQIPDDGFDQGVGGTTIGEMAVALLAGAGDSGMTSGEILDAIRKTWMPSLARTSLSPPLSRLKKRGEIILDGEHWKLAAENEANRDE